MWFGFGVMNELIYASGLVIIIYCEVEIMRRQNADATTNKAASPTNQNDIA